MLVQSLIVILMNWILPAALSGGIIAAFAEALKFLGVSSWWAWLMIAPTLYLCWLIFYLAFCGLSNMAILKRFPKPRHVIYDPADPRKVRGVGASLIRKQVIESLPLTAFLRSLPLGGQLVLFSYSPSMHIGKGVGLGAPIIFDPDLTEIGDYVVLGAGATIVAHLLKAHPDGKRRYVSAPVKIQNGATIGAYSMVSPGCTVGEDSIIEPHSYLPPYTHVPANELWGGRPAVFLRKLSTKAEAEPVAGRREQSA